MSEAEHLADWLDQAATAADLGRPEVKTDNRRLAAKALRKQQAEIDALRAKLAALEGAYIPTYLERLAASPATLEAEFTALRSEALDLRAALAERDALQAKITVLEGHAHAGLLEAFDAYARQFTYNSHPAKPEHFPKSFPWFSAGYAAAGAAPVPQGRKITATRIANHLKKSPLGDISMYRNGFFDGAKWAAAPKEPT